MIASTQWPGGTGKSGPTSLNDELSRDLVTVDGAEDVRGCHVLDTGGAEVGIVTDMLTSCREDPAQEQAACLLEVTPESGSGSKDEKFLLPLEVIAAIGDHVVVVDAR